MLKSYICPECQKLFARKSSRDKHHLFHHRDTTKSPTRTPLNQPLQCPFYENKVISFKSRKDLVSHIDASHLENLNYSLYKSALNGKIKFYRKQIFSKETLHGFAANKENRQEIVDVIHHELSKIFTVKVAIILSVAYKIPDLNSASEKKDIDPDTINIDDTTKKPSDQSSHQLLSNDRDVFALRTSYIQFTPFDSSRSLKGKVQKLLHNLVSREEDLLMRGSRWRFESLSFSDIQISSIRFIGAHFVLNTKIQITFGNGSYRNSARFKHIQLVGMENSL